MMTEAQAALLTQVSAVLKTDGRIRSIWLSGSLARGVGDTWSDVDLVAQVDEADRAACLADYGQGGAGWPDLVHAQQLHGRVLTATTVNWQRFDVSFLTPSELAIVDGAGLKHLAGDATATPPDQPPSADTRAPRRIAALITEFLRVLGLLPVAVGREEWLGAQQGYDLLRRMFIELMIEENGVTPTVRGGAKRLNLHLSADQRKMLEAIAPPLARRETLISANLELARLFLDRARPLADRLDAPWPLAFEQATRRHLQRCLEVEI